MDNQVKATLEAINAKNASVNRKWAGHINKVNESRTAAGMERLNPWTATVLSTVLETYTTRTAIASQRRNAVLESTQASDVGYLRTHGINILTAAMPNLIANDILSVQPLQARVGEIRYLDVKYGNDKGTIHKGDTMYAFDRIGAPNDAQFDYTSADVNGEALIMDSDNKATRLSYLPVVEGTVNLVNGSDVYTDKEGKLFKDGAEVGTINYETGAIAFTSAITPTDPTVSYQYDNISSPVQAPELNLSIRPLPVMAQARKLKTVMSFDAMYDLNAQYGFDANTEQTALAANFLQYEIDGELIEDMYRGAAATPTTFSKTVPNAVSKLDHYEGFTTTMIEAGNNIFKDTRFANGTFGVLGLEAATIVESLANRGFVPSGQFENGPHYIGSVGNLQLYKTPQLSNNNGYFVGYKGESMFHAGMVYAPYMPIMSTDLLAYETFDIKQGYATAYAKKMVNPKLYSKGTITA